jgi:thiol-disulfide isomerase/thioredoxin
VIGLLLTGQAALGVGYLEPYEAPDEPPPDLALPDLEGVTHRLADYRGKVVLLNFWASWCTPCIQEMPGMYRLAQERDPERFQILAVNVAEVGARAKRALRTAGVELPVLLDRDSGAFAAWGVRVLPTSFLLDPDGKIRYVGLGPIEWDGAEAAAHIDRLQAAAPRGGAEGPEGR